MWSYINVILKIRILCSEFIRPTGYIEPCFLIFAAHDF